MKSGWTDLRTEISGRLLVTGDIPVFGELCVHELDFNKTWGIFSNIFFGASARKGAKSPSEMSQTFFSVSKICPRRNQM